MFAVRASYVAPRRGTESQRARPSRCEALPPKPERRKASWGGFLKRPGAASFFVQRCAAVRYRGSMGGRISYTLVSLR